MSRGGLKSESHARDCNSLVPITAVWQKCWSMIYWLICSVLLLDSWNLSWKIGKKWIFLPLFSLLLLSLLSGAAVAAKNSTEATTEESVTRSQKHIAPQKTDNNEFPNSPVMAIQADVRPGQCWAFKGSEGYLVIQLAGWVQPSRFLLQHIPRSAAPDGIVDDAPKEFSVYGLLEENDFNGVPLGRFSYDIDGDSRQYFNVPDPNLGPFPIVELRIHSNHGNSEYTCLYRFGVHGKLVKPLEVKNKNENV